MNNPCVLCGPDNPCICESKRRYTDEQLREALIRQGCPTNMLKRKLAELVALDEIGQVHIATEAEILEARDTLIRQEKIKRYLEGAWIFGNDEQKERVGHITSGTAPGMEDVEPLTDEGFAWLVEYVGFRQVVHRDENATNDHEKMPPEFTALEKISGQTCYIGSGQKENEVKHFHGMVLRWIDGGENAGHLEAIYEDPERFPTRMDAARNVAKKFPCIPILINPGTPAEGFIYPYYQQHLIRLKSRMAKAEQDARLKRDIMNQFTKPRDKP